MPLVTAASESVVDVTLATLRAVKVAHAIANVVKTAVDVRRQLHDHRPVNQVHTARIIK